MPSRHPQVRIRGNGRLRSISTPAGRGALFFEWISLSRWQEATPAACGPFIYLSENDDWDEHADAASLGLDRSLEIEVHPELDIEIRRLALRDLTGNDRHIVLTFATEVALHHPMGDAGHPAFAKLFIQTEADADRSLLLARRRPRGHNEHWPWYGQLLGGDIESISWQTNRVPCLGRGRGWNDPALLDTTADLPGETGNVLDPVFCWRGHVRIPARGEARVYLVSACAKDREQCVALLDNPSAAALEAVLAQGAAARAKAGLAFALAPSEQETCDACIAALLGADPRMKAPAPASMDGSDIVHRWALGAEQSRILFTGTWDGAGGHWLRRAVPYWRSLGLDPRVLVAGTAPENLPEGFESIAEAGLSASALAWLAASAQWVVGDAVLDLPAPVDEALPRLRNAITGDKPLQPGETLAHWNGYGGFTKTNEYTIIQPLENGRLKRPPMPWINVLANKSFGCLVSESGAGYTWARNSQANRLSPWSNDPVRDPHTEAIYLRDPSTGGIWSPLPGPCPAASPFVVTHGRGTTTFVSESCGFKMETTFVVPPDDPVKVVVLRLECADGSARELDVASWMDLVMASQMDRHHATLAWTAADGISRAMNPRAGDFKGGIAFSFVSVDGCAPAESCAIHSRAAMFGIGIERSWPRCWNRLSPDSARGFGRDAGFGRAFRVTIEPGITSEIVFVLGEVMSEDQVGAMADRYCRPGAAEETISRTLAFWQGIIGRVRIETPLPGVDRLVNGWLVYQNLACRIWARSAFYQSGGAYGFRDQLQDSAAFAALQPGIFREQILLHAAHQFREGDVMHWWHPVPMKRGMRTNFSDDLLWLPYLLSHYLESTGDTTVLDEVRPFLKAELLPEGEDELYLKPELAEESGTIFEHACRSIDRSLTRGAHGLPLMGIGDWNDGMSRIGREGKGESVWLGFFLHDILGKWIPLCRMRGETKRADVYESYLANLNTALESSGWDGAWYRRAYYDDGTPLGTIDGGECIIDALAQAWAVISKAAPPGRAAAALDALEERLVDADAGIIRLLTPPFADTPHDPGYIKGYVAGVRENGGQYTHAACWVVRAMAEAGRRDTAAALLEKLSPVWHTRDESAVARYQTEPFVIAADIYGAEPHVGRGGWTWYTGSAGWFQRVVIESVLGLTLKNGASLVLRPRVPDSWRGFSIEWKEPDGLTRHHIVVSNPHGRASNVAGFLVDGTSGAVSDGAAGWPLFGDGATHRIQIELG